MTERGYVYELLRELGLSEFAARTGEFIVVRPLKIILILLVAMIAARLGGRAVRRAVRGLRARAPIPSTSARAEQRAATLGDVLASGLRAVVWAVAVLIVLDEVGVNVAPLLAGAGIAGIAIGFGAQSLVKDVIAGLFILLEDQYGVGDVVTLQDATGTVEDLTLRVTRLRSTDGTVWFVPNGEVRKVGNGSMEYSRAVIDVVVGYDVDLDLVRRVMVDEAVALAAEEAWVSSITGQPEDAGIHQMDATSVTLRLIVQTAPRQQFAVSRELRGRITARLKAEGVRGKPAA